MLVALKNLMVAEMLDRVCLESANKSRISPREENKREARTVPNRGDLVGVLWLRLFPVH